MSENSNVFEMMQEILADALGVDPSEVEMQSRLMADLGAESIDVLDISFRIEEEYDVALPTKDWTELFSQNSGQLEASELAECLNQDFGIELSDEECERFADKPLVEILDDVQARHGIEITQEHRLRYAELGTKALLEGFGELLHTTIDGATRDAINEAASRCGFDEQFWWNLSNVMTVERLVDFVEHRIGEKQQAAEVAA